MKTMLILLFVPLFVFTQSSWQRSIETVPQKVELFHSSKTANFPTTENLLQGNFVFEISHRFETINEGYDNFFGLDGPVNIRIALGYGITDDLMVTLGRSNILANLDIAFKYKLKDFDSDKFPSSLALNVGSGFVNRDIYSVKQDIKIFDPDYTQFYGQLVYNIMFFDKKLAIGIVPSFVYNSYIFAAGQGLDTKTTFTLGTCYQYYFNRMWSIWAEYSTVLSGYDKSIISNTVDAYDPIAFGTAIETGGHIFHLFVTNSSRLNPAQFLIGADHNTDSDAWRFGFGITREL